jgi:hypothetical protein
MANELDEVPSLRLYGITNPLMRKKRTTPNLPRLKPSSNSICHIGPLKAGSDVRDQTALNVCCIKTHIAATPLSTSNTSKRLEAAIIALIF